MIENLGDRIRRARKKNEFTMSVLAEKIGISTSAIGSFESGKSKPSVENLVKISEICDVELDWLLKGQGPRKVLGEIKEKSQDNGAYKSELDKASEEIEHLRQQVRALTRAINLMPEHVGKDEVIDLKAGMPQKKKVAIANSAGMVSASMTRQPIMLQ